MEYKIGDEVKLNNDKDSDVGIVTKVCLDIKGGKYYEVDFPDYPLLGTSFSKEEIVPVLKVVH